MGELREGEWIARVTRKGDKLEAKLNPKLSASERTYIAAMAAGMFAQLAAEGILGLSAELVKAPKVLKS